MHDGFDIHGFVKKIISQSEAGETKDKQINTLRTSPLQKRLLLFHPSPSLPLPPSHLPSYLPRYPHPPGHAPLQSADLHPIIRNKHFFFLSLSLSDRRRHRTTWLTSPHQKRAKNQKTRKKPQKTIKNTNTK